MPERNRRWLPSVGVLAAIAALGLLSACAAKPAQEASTPAQAPPAQAPPAGVQSYGQADEPSDDDMAVMSLDQAAAAFEEAELRISGLLGMGGAAPPVAIRGDEAQVDTASVANSARRTSGLAEGPDRCLIACRALASMQRSATRLCELTGEDDVRCEDVRDRVEQARQLVSGECPSCIVAQLSDE